MENHAQLLANASGLFQGQHFHLCLFEQSVEVQPALAERGVRQLSYDFPLESFNATGLVASAPSPCAECVFELHVGVVTECIDDP